MGIADSGGDGLRVGHQGEILYAVWRRKPRDGPTSLENEDDTGDRHPPSGIKNDGLQAGRHKERVHAPQSGA